LSPTDGAVNDEYRKWKEEMDEKAFMAKSNPLALAGALGDDDAGEGKDADMTEISEPKVS
jgi:THO complex subunit 2 N-terminus